MIGSWEPVTHDAYYEAKKKAGLIGRPEEYSTMRDVEETIDYIAAFKRPDWSVDV